MRWLVLLSYLVLGVCACGGTTTPPAPAPIVAPGAPSLPCALPTETPIPLPQNFAPNLPIPTGAKWHNMATMRNDTHTQVQVTGVVPLSLWASARFITVEFAKAGYLITSSEQELYEAEGLFKGNGWIRSYRVNLIDGCDAATTWIIRVLKL